MKHVETFVFSFFVAFGMLFMIVGLCLFIPEYSKQQQYQPITAEITDIRPRGNDDYTVLVSYTVDEAVYTQPLNMYSSSYYIGKKIDILYSPENPNEITSKNFAAISLIFPGIGFLFAGIGFIGFYVRIRKKNMRRRLTEYGERIYADFAEVSQNLYYSVNGRHPFQVICRWKNPADDQIYTFKSENIWEYPAFDASQQIPIYIDTFNLKKYYIALDEISQKAEQAL